MTRQRGCVILYYYDSRTVQDFASIRIEQAWEQFWECIHLHIHSGMQNCQSNSRYLSPTASSVVLFWCCHWDAVTQKMRFSRETNVNEAPCEDLVSELRGYTAVRMASFCCFLSADQLVIDTFGAILHRLTLKMSFSSRFICQHSLVCSHYILEPNWAPAGRVGWGETMHAQLYCSHYICKPCPI